MGAVFLSHFLASKEEQSSRPEHIFLDLLASIVGMADPNTPAWISDPPQPPQYDASSTGTYGTSGDNNGNNNRLYAWGAVKVIILGCAAMMAANGVLAMINIAHSSNPVSDCFVVSSCSIKFPACKKL